MTLPMMLLGVLLSPVPQEPAEPAAPPAQVEPTSSAVQAHIDAGLAAFKRRRFSRAADEFRKALDAEPNNAAATFYMAYTIYKIAEPKRPFHPEKQRAAEMFAKAYELDPDFRPAWAPRK
jgi:Tfp pilus assembly protein PilF